MKLQGDITRADIVTVFLYTLAPLRSLFSFPPRHPLFFPPPFPKPLPSHTSQTPHPLQPLTKRDTSRAGLFPLRSHPGHHHHRHEHNPEAGSHGPPHPRVTFETHRSFLHGSYRIPLCPVFFSDREKKGSEKERTAVGVVAWKAVDGRLGGRRRIFWSEEETERE